MRKPFLLAAALYLSISIALAQNTQAVFSAAATQLQKDLALDSLQGSIAIAVFHKNDLIWSNAFGNTDDVPRIVLNA